MTPSTRPDFDPEEALRDLRLALEAAVDTPGAGACSAVLQITTGPGSTVPDLSLCRPEQLSKVLQGAMGLSCMAARPDLVRLLASLGADPSLPEPISWNEQTGSPLKWSARNTGHGGPDRAGRHPVAYAILSGDRETFDTLLALGADPMACARDNFESLWGLARKTGWAAALDFFKSLPPVCNPASPDHHHVWLMIGSLSKSACLKDGDHDALASFISPFLGDPAEPSPSAEGIVMHLMTGGAGSGGLPGIVPDFHIRARDSMAAKLPAGFYRAWKVLSEGMAVADETLVMSALSFLDQNLPPGPLPAKAGNSFPSDSVFLDRIDDSLAADPSFTERQRRCVLSCLSAFPGRPPSPGLVETMARRAAWRGHSGILEAALDLGADPVSIASLWEDENREHGIGGGRASVVNRRGLALCSMALAARSALSGGRDAASRSLASTGHHFLVCGSLSPRVSEALIDEALALASLVEERLMLPDPGTESRVTRRAPTI